MSILRIPGVHNLRDVGGIPVQESHVRHGILLRSGQLSDLTPRGSEELSGRVRQVIDLRDDDEVARQPSALAGVQVERIPLLLGSVESFFMADTDLAGLYRHLVDECAAQLVAAVRVIAAGRPTLVHCTVGKDRTGVVVALALSAVGADRDAVVADYALTASQLSPERNRTVVQYLRTYLPDARNAVQLATESPAPVMAALLRDLDERYGSVAAYLQRSGLSEAELAALRAALVEESGRARVG